MKAWILQAAKEGIGEIAMPIIPRSRLWLPLYLLVYGRSYGTIYGLFSHNAFCRWLFVVCSHLFNSVLVSQFMDINEKILTKKLIRLTLILGSAGLLILFLLWRSSWPWIFDAIYRSHVLAV
jgi:hypothetical protein